MRKKDDDKILHQDLLNDIKERDIRANIISYNSLYSFINDNIDKNHHELDHDRLIEAIESDIVSEGLEYIREAKELDVGYRTESGLFSTTISEIISISTELIEGLEDPEVMFISKFNDNDVHVGYSYNLRRVSLNVEVSKSNYLLNMNKFDEIFFETKLVDDTAILSSVVRPYFYISFIYNKEEEYLEDFYVDQLTIEI